MRGTAATGITYLKRIAATAATLLALSSAVLVAGAQAAAYQVIGTGGTLHVRTAPSLSAATVGEMRDGAWIDIVCQTTGDTVVGSNIWDKIDSPYVGYVADWYTTTPAVGKFSPGLPVCGSSTPPPPPPPQPEVELRNNDSLRCLDAESQGIRTNGTKVMLWECWGGSNQNWRIYPDGTIRNAESSRCLDADTNTIANNGTVVQLWDCTGGANQRWSIGADGTIRNAASGRCLDAESQSIGANGTKVMLWNCWGALNQKWHQAPASTRVAQSHYSYCSQMATSLVLPDLPLNPCVTVNYLSDGISAATSSIAASACPSFAQSGSLSDTCRVLKSGSRWNGTTNVAYVNLALTFQTTIVAGYGGYVVSYIELEEDEGTLEVETSPIGVASGHKSVRFIRTWTHTS